MISLEIGKLAEATETLVNSTIDVTREKVWEARNRLERILQRGKEIYDHIHAKEIEGAGEAEKAMHEHAYEAIAIAIGVGTLTAQIFFSKYFND